MSKIFIIAGPSGSGKTTLAKNLLKHPQLKDRLVKSVSLTTRPKRSGEKEARDYFFISEKEFYRLRKSKKILEWTRYLGYYYATPKDFVEDRLAKGRDLIFCLDLKGTLKIKRFYPQNTVAIFILPPSLAALQERIEKRCQKTKQAEIRERLRMAKEEVLASHRYDYCLTNRKLQDTVTKLKEVILKEITGRKDAIRTLRKSFR